MRADEARFQRDDGLALVERVEREGAAVPAFMRIAAPDQDFAHALRRESRERRHRPGCMRGRALSRGDGGLHGLVAVFPGGLGHGESIAPGGASALLHQQRCDEFQAGKVSRPKLSFIS